MIPATSNFITAVQENGRHFDAKIYIGATEVDCEVVGFKSVKGSSEADFFSVGAVFSNYAEITVQGLSQNLENEDISLKLGILLSDGTYDYINYGKYTIIKVQSTVYQSILTAVGMISSKMNIPIANMTTPTLSAIITAISQASGVTINTSGFSGLSNTITKDLVGLTCRGALEIVTFLLGGYATEDYTGTVQIKKFEIPSTLYSLDDSHYSNIPVTADDDFEMTGIKVIVTPESEDEEGTIIPEVSYSSGTPIRQTYQSEYMTQAIFNVFATNVIGYQFMPAQVNQLLGDPRLEPWDCLAVTDINSTIYTVPCHTITASFDGGFTCAFASIGESVTDVEVEGSITKQIGEMAGSVAVAQTAAAQAKAAAAQAQAAATEATDLLDDMRTAAEEAGTTLLDIYQDAEDANASATAANTAALTAVTQLGYVEDVLGTLQWIQQHGEYGLTTDTTPTVDKYYFERSGTGTTEDPYIYSVVTPSEDSDPSTLGLYELTGVDDAVSNYVSTHIAVTDAGLYLQNGETAGTKVLLSPTDGVILYDQDGIETARYGTVAQIGRSDGFHISIDPNTAEGGEIGFYDGTTRVAYVSGNKLYIEQSVVLSEMQLGENKWSWKLDPSDDSINLTWIG